jgi:hypothetical protein
MRPTCTMPWLLALLALACDSPPSTATAGTSTSSTRPPVQLVARTVEVQKTITGRSPGGGRDDEESWTADEGRKYVLVTVDLLHNQCAEGDRIAPKEASLVLAGTETAEVAGGGATRETVCVLCEPNVPVDCRGGQAPMRPYTFVFAVAESTDLTKAKLRYRGQDAELAVATITDKRGNEEIDRQIMEKKDEIARLKKELERTGSKSAGEVILQDIAERNRAIEELQKKRR